MKIPNSLIFDSLADVVFFLSIESDQFRFAQVNKAFLSITGLNHEQVVGKLVQDVIPEPSLSLVLTKYRTAISEKRTVKWEEVTTYPNGKKYGEVTIVPVFDDAGKCTSLVGNVHDVTALKEAEIERKNTMDRISDGIVAFDANFNYTFINSRGAESLGFAPEELLGKNYFTLFPESKGTPFAKAFVESFKTQKPIEIRELYEPWNRWFENRIFPSQDGLTIFFREITEEVKKEMELGHARIDAENALIAKSRFLDIAAHELRNPVASLYLMLQVIDRQIQNGIPVDHEKIVELLHPASRLNRLVSDLLDLSRLEKDVVRLNMGVHDLHHCIDGWINELQLIYPHRKIIYHAKEKVISFAFDALRIYQVFTNLVENAIKYSPGTSPIDVTLEDLVGEVRVSVTDQGEGIPQKRIESIFDPFSRGGVDIKVRHTGLGLGLPISDRIIKLHHGSINVMSEEGKGSTFSFNLPKKALT